MSGSLAPLLEGRNLGRRHPDGRRWLLKNVSLEIHPRTRLSVAGPSGSGKTLLLRALAMLDPLDEGQVCWKGQPVSCDRVPSFRSTAIYLHQRPALLEENVEAVLRRPFSLKVHAPRSYDRRRVVDMLGQLGRDESFLAKRTRDLSGGEIQIAALLRAVQLDPHVLLLDEPTAALDPQAATAVEELLGRWIGDSSGSRAVVWVTHDPQQARRMAQKPLQMQQGRLTDAG